VNCIFFITQAVVKPQGCVSFLLPLVLCAIGYYTYCETAWTARARPKCVKMYKFQCQVWNFWVIASEHYTGSG